MDRRVEFNTDHEDKDSFSLPNVIISRELRSVENQDTVQSKTSIGSIGRLMQLLKLVDARRLERRNQSIATSYLGTTLPTKYAMRNQILFYKQRFQVYNSLHRPRGIWAIGYHILVFIMVFACLTVTVFSTIEEFEDMAWIFMVELQKIMLVWFGGEFLIRLWASSCKAQYQGFKGKLRYLRSPFRIIDIIVIGVSITVLWVDPRNGYEVFAISAFRGFHRFFQVIQMIRSERQFRPWRVLASVLYAQREQLIITCYIGFLALCFAALLSYLAEKNVNNDFDSIADALWWAVVTLCTVGYGDRVPVTWLGKLIACIFTILGVSIFALPAGIIGTGLAINVQEEQRVLRRRQKKLPAALLIQCCWRCYAANPESRSIATWALHKPFDLISERERNALRFIRMIKFLMAKQSFKSRLVQTDIKDVLEQYQIGHSSILYRIKEIQNDLDSLVENVEHNAKRMEETKTSLISRLEQINKDIDKKLDNQIECIKNLIHFECLSNQSSNDTNKIRNRDNIRDRRNSMV